MKFSEAKLSDVLEKSIHDATGLNRELYRPQFSHWHHAPFKITQCAICLGGAWLAAQGHPRDIPVLDLDQDVTPQQARVLRCLDYVRTGHYSAAYRELKRKSLTADQAWDINSISTPRQTCFTNWEQFTVHLASLESVVSQLREKGF